LSNERSNIFNHNNPKKTTTEVDKRWRAGKIIANVTTRNMSNKPTNRKEETTAVGPALVTEEVILEVERILKNTEMVESELLSEDRTVTAEVIHRILHAAGITDFSSSNTSTTDTYRSSGAALIDNLKNKWATITTMRQRFHFNPEFRCGCSWGRIEENLLKNPEALRTVILMEQQGHQPAVYNADEEGFDIGTCSIETPESTRGKFYDDIAVSNANIDEQSAESQAEEMGLELMSPQQYVEYLQDKGNFDMDGYTWLKTKDFDPVARKALTGNRFSKRRPKSRFALINKLYKDTGVLVSEIYTCYPHNNHGWRGTVRVNWTC